MVLQILSIISYIFTGILVLYALWLGGLGIIGVLAAKKRDYKAKVDHTFAIIICARNEEMVIGNLIESLNKQSYPSDKYKVFVVAHNCTDNTAEIAAQHGAEVFVRNAKGEIKQNAQKYGLDQIKEKYGDYFEYFAAFDADALADKDFLYEMNATLDATDADCASGYYSSKNFDTNIVTKVSGMLYHILMQQSTIPHDNLGLPVNIYGSGYAAKMKWASIIDNVTTIVDDFEFTCYLVLNGGKMVMAPKAVFYAEMPVTLREGLKQRKRWAFGTTQCYRKFHWRFVRSIPKLGMSAIKEYSEAALNPITAVGTLGLLLFLVTSIISGLTWVHAVIFGSIVVMIYLIMFMMSAITIVKAHLGFRNHICATFLSPFWIFLSIFYGITTLFKRSMEWKATARTSTASIEDMKK